MDYTGVIFELTLIGATELWTMCDFDVEMTLCDFCNKV